MKKKLDWKQLGQFFSVLLNVFAIIRNTFKKMNVGIEIIPWLVGNGKDIFIGKFLKPLGEEYLKQERDAVKEVNERGNKLLKLISGGETLTLDACDGSEGLADANDTFAWIDRDFENYGADQKGPATEEAPVSVYEMGKDATFAKIFGSLNADVRRLLLTPHQIKNFVRKHRRWLRTDGYGTFFLFESNGELFVALVGFYSGDGLDVHVRRFEYSYVWYAGSRHRIVVPQLA